MSAPLRRLNEVDAHGKVFVGALLFDDWTLVRPYVREVQQVLRPENLSAFTWRARAGQRRKGLNGVGDGLNQFKGHRRQIE